MSNTIIKASLVNGAIIVDNTAETMRKPIFPLSLVVSTERKKIVKL